MQIDTKTSKQNRGSTDNVLRQLQDIAFALEHSAIVAITDKKGKIQYVNDRFCEISQYEREELIGKDHRIVNSGYHPKSFFKKMWTDIKKGHIWKGEICNKKKDGQCYWVNTTIVPFLDETDEPYQYISIRHEITNRKWIEERLKMSEQRYKRIALTDALTKLPNRLKFIEFAQELIKKNVSFTVVCLDLDRFKLINDTLGHQNGDLLLCKVVKRLQSLLGKEAALSRVGGDEFFLLLQNNSVLYIKDLIEAIIQSFQAPFFVQEKEIYITGSLGVCTYPTDGADTEALMKNVEIALYRAKEEGRNTYHFFNDELREVMKRRAELEWSLQKAIRQQQLEVYLQPIVDASGEYITGTEALLRWKTKEHGFVSPVEFIPIAEESGLIVSIGEWVLEEACRVSVELQNENQNLANKLLSVNVSIQQLLQNDFVQTVKDILKRTRFPAEQLVLEITESVVMQHITHAAQVLQRLRDEGVRIALDDFGTGYSSLNYLKQLPIDILKIDRSFIQDITHSPTDLAIVQSVIDIAHHLNLTVVAEGVELLEQRECLVDIQCDRVQGYYYSPPVPAYEMLQLSENKRYKWNTNFIIDKGE